MSINKDSTAIDYDDPKYRITPAQQAAASCTGALITSVIMTPLDVVKIRMQAQQKAATTCYLYCNGIMDHICSCQPTDPKNPWYKRPTHFTGTLDAFLKISRHEGIISLWSGLSPTLVLAIPATICYFVTYEQLRLKLKSIANKNKPESRHQPMWVPLISGGTARILSVTLVNPLELIRTKMQSQRLSYFEIGEAVRNLIRTNGIKGLWKGIVPTLLRDVPFSAIYWMTYETLKNIMWCDRPSFMETFIGGAISGSLAAAITVPFDVVKTHKQIEFGSSLFTENLKGDPIKSRTTMEIIRDIYKQHGIKGLYSGLTPRLIKVAPACAIMISSFEYGKVFFNRLANQREFEILNEALVINEDKVGN